MKLRLLLIASLFLLGASIWLMPTQAQKTKKAKGKSSLKPHYSQAIKAGVSQRARDLPTPDVPEGKDPRVAKKEFEINPLNVEQAHKAVSVPNRLSDAALQNRPDLPDVLPGPNPSFDGISNQDNFNAFGFRISPPDTEGDVGPNHYVQGNNLLVRIYDKAGNPLTAPFKQSSLFAALGGACSTNDDGDPIVLYDPLADRWLISQFAFNNATFLPPYSMCIAISTTADPTGTYFVYDFITGGNEFPDYPKLGVWPDGYYLTTRQFTNGGPFNGSGAGAFDRKKMLVGDPTAALIYFNLGNPPIDLSNMDGGLLPSDIDGFLTPPAGAPNVFAIMTSNEFDPPQGDAIRLFNFHADFDTPALSTFTERTESPVAVAAFDPVAPGDLVGNRRDIPQPPPAVVPTNNLDSIARLLHRLQYRNFGGFEQLVANHAVNADSPGTFRSGVRYYELRRTLPGGASFTVAEQATFAPTTTGSGGNPEHRWMASAAADNQNNLAVGYSVAGLGTFPSIRYAGRAFNDPPNGLFQGETSLIAGSGVQLSASNRWGDYSMMAVDPADDCTFWYTQEYYTAASQATSVVGWVTRVGAFKFAACTAPAQGTLSGTVTNCAGGAILGATVLVSGGPSAGFSRQTNSAGLYSMGLAPGTYTVTFSGPSCTDVVVNNVVITAGATTTLNQCLTGDALIESAGATIVSEGCSPANGAIDPDETVTVSLCVENNGCSSTTNLVGTLQATGGVTSPSGPQNYGMVTPGGPAVCRNFTFTAAGSCGGTITATLQLQDGATNLGTLAYNFTLGAAGPAATRSFTFSPGVVIPDNNPAGVNIPFVVSGITGSIADLNFSIDGTSCNTTNPSLTVGVDHSWVGDLTFRLTPPDGSPTVTLIQTPGGGGVSGNNFCQTLLDDDGAFPSIQSIQSTGPPPLGPPYTGTFLPANPLSALDGENANGTWTLNVSDTAAVDTGFVRAFSLIFRPFVCCVSTGACTITCPPNQVVSNDPGMCCAVVNYPAPTTSGTCGAVTCVPPSGTCFPVGTTTVTCTETGGASCPFLVTVNDTQPPVIDCPDDIIAVTANPGDFCVPVQFNVTAADNCPAVTFTCVNQANGQPITSGFCFPATTNCTTVVCTATDASGNTATCSFEVCVFDVCLEDDGNPFKVLLFNSFTGDYIFCCDTFSVSGKGTVKKKGNTTFTLTHNPSDRRVLATVYIAQHKGNASLQIPPGTPVCTIQDRDFRDNSCICAEED